MKFFFGILAGCLTGIALFTILVSLAAGRPMVETQGFAASFQRKKEIADSINKSKVIFTGGSSVDAGISAQQASALLGRPAVNFGLIAPLGIHYITHKVKDVAKPGDTVVLALEYFLYDWPGHTGFWLDPMFVSFVTAQDSDYLDQLTFWNRANILARMSTSQLTTALLRRSKIQEQSFENMNEYGDFIGNSLEARPKIAPDRAKPLEHLKDGLGDNPKGFRSVENFINWAKLNEINVIATFPNTARNQLYDDEMLARIEERLKVFYNSLGVPVVGSLKGAMFSEEDCFDSPNHLTAPAVERRTEALCKELNAEFQNALPQS